MPIAEQGYQHWSGRLSGHAWRWLAITHRGVQIQFRNRFLRYVLFAAWTPAFLLVCMLSIWGLLEQKSKWVSTVVQFLRFINPQVIAQPRYYRLDVWRLCYGYFMHVELFFSMLIVLIVGPGLISQDLRVNALPLYFSRPLRRIDYFLGKLGVISFFIGMVTILPAVIAYVFGLLFSLNWRVAVVTFPILLAAVTYGIIICISAGTLMLAFSSLSRNLRYVALFWLGFWFVSGVVSDVLISGHNQQLRSQYYHSAPALQPSTGAPSGRLLSRQYWRQFHSYQFEAQLHDWRPLVSYTGNLNRLGNKLLGINDVWLKLAKLEPNRWRRSFLLMRFGGPWYPWYWSLALLTGLFLGSAGLLKWSIRSFDRMK